jgi:hypothetical protein
LRLEPSPLQWDDELRAWVAYVGRAQALRQLARWGAELIQDAKERIHAAAKVAPERSRADLQRILNDAVRARFCAPPPEHPNLREEAFACWGAAWILDGRLDALPALLRDARRDFPGEQIVERIEATARRLAKPQNPTYPERNPREHLSWDRPAKPREHLS